MRIKIGIACIVLLTLAITHLFIGSTDLSLSDFISALTNYNDSDTNQVIARDLRLPRMITAIIAGASLSVAGLLMQTIFNNPLAEPNILGVSTGSSLFVAITLMTGVTFFSSDLGIIMSALTGAFIFGIIILFFARFVKSPVSLLLIGIMLASFTSSFISIIQAWSDAHKLKLFTLWSMGSLQQVTFQQIPLIASIFIVGLIASFGLIKSLNALVLGQNNAFLLGINIRQIRIITIFISSILSGLITAFCGPIAFLGMAVPNLSKIILKTQNHLTLIFASAILGSVFLLFCDIMIQLLANQFLLPINAMTALIGAPFIIYILFKRMP